MDKVDQVEKVDKVDKVDQGGEGGLRWTKVDKVNCHFAKLPEMAAAAQRRILNQRLIVSIIDPTVPLKTVQS